MSEFAAWTIGMVIAFVLGNLVGMMISRTKRVVDEAYFTEEFYLKLVGGPGKGQRRRITGVTIDEPFDPPASTATVYEIQQKLTKA